MKKCNFDVKIAVGAFIVAVLFLCMAIGLVSLPYDRKTFIFFAFTYFRH